VTDWRRLPVVGFGASEGQDETGDRNGEPAEGDMGCLIMWFALGGIMVVFLGSYLGFLASLAR